MIEKDKRFIFLLYIILGILFAAIGVIGLFPEIIRHNQNSSKGNYRYFSKISPEFNTAIEVNQALENTLSPDITGNNSEIQTDFHNASFLVHPVIHPELEDPFIPEEIEIPKIKLDAPIVVAEFDFTKVEGETFGQWLAPSEYAAGWHPNSALLGQKGNTVINGHHNEYGEVFSRLIDLKEGDLINVYSHGKRFSYVITNKMIFAERWQKAEVRLENAMWLGKSNDERLTLVTCWPAESNTHRLILVAQPYQP